MNPDAQRLLADYAETLKQRPDRVSVTVTGAVVQLRRTGAFGPGDVVISGRLSDEPSAPDRRVNINLDEASYNDAYAAHGRGQTVRVTGDVTRSGNYLALRSPRNFTVIKDLFDLS